MTAFRKGSSVSITQQLFFQLLPVQISILAMNSINSLIDGVMAGRFIDPSIVGVIGLYYTMVRVLEAIGSVLLSGTTILCGRYLGAGKLQKTRGVYSLTCALAILLGGLLTLLSFCMPFSLAKFLGANEAMQLPLILYIKGFAIGIVPQLLGKLLSFFLQMERQEKRSQVAIWAMILTNLSLDYLLIAVLHMGVMGLALATSLASWVYFLILASYYLTGKAQIIPGLSSIQWGELWDLLSLGIPAAILIFALAGRSLVLNRLLVRYAGTDAMSALGALNLIFGLMLAFCVGSGAVLLMLASVYLGEENREGLLSLIKLMLTKVMAIAVGLALLFVMISPLLTSFFFPDRSSHVYSLTQSLIIIQSLGIIPSMLCQIFNNYFQAAKHRVFIFFISVVDGFISVILPASILIPRFGAMGAWFSFPIGLFITLLCSVMYCVVRCGHWPRSLAEWCLLPKDFGEGEHLELTIRQMDQVVQASEMVQSYCQKQGVDEQTAMHAALCLEETTRNILQHGFSADTKPHVVEIRVLVTEHQVLLRTKDNCLPFNPQERAQMLQSESDPFRNIGIRLISRLAKEMSYQNLLGLNVLTITL